MTPMHAYQKAIQEGELTADPHQAAVMAHIEHLYHDFKKSIRQKRSLLAILSPFKTKSTTPGGIYLWGGVGVGKTCLMDLFVRCLPEKCYTRTHFHRFMKDIHHQLREHQGQTDPIIHIAKEIAVNTRILCFDEFIVNDIADAMILALFLKTLFEQGVFLFATSNLPPHDLYHHGLQRQRFLPAIALLEHHCQVIHIPSENDYRLRELEKDGLYFDSIDQHSNTLLEAKFKKLCKAEIEWATTITIEARPVHVIAKGADIIWFAADQLIDVPRCSRDWLEISKFYQTVFISDLPIIEQMSHNYVRNFINMIDIFYDAHVNCVFQAATSIENLYSGGRFALEFERTKSRLFEMQSRRYISGSHL